MTGGAQDLGMSSFCRFFLVSSITDIHFHNFDL